MKVFESISHTDESLILTFRNTISPIALDEVPANLFDYVKLISGEKQLSLKSITKDGVKYTKETASQLSGKHIILAERVLLEFEPFDGKKHEYIFKITSNLPVEVPFKL